MASAMPDLKIITLALLYSVGAHGIMTLNDFKAIDGDRRMGATSWPVQLGGAAAGRLAFGVLALPQVVVVGLLVAWGKPWHALAVAVLIVAQGGLMRRLLRDPRKWAAWYNGTGTTLYVIGMMVAAFAVAPLIAGGPAAGGV